VSSIVGVQSYTWTQIYQEQKKQFQDHLDEVFGFIKDAGYDAWEGTPSSKLDAQKQKSLLDKHGLAAPSAYLPTMLHMPDWEKQVDSTVQRASYAQILGATVIVTNPSPTKELKTDEQLKRQAEALNVLGGKLASEGLKLLYHFHAPEMRAAAREVHHMMLGTDPGHMGLCLDVHWAYRGAENSQVALYDLVTLYARRIGELHLRQSKDGVWTEVFEDGDIDYRPLAELLKHLDFSGPLMLEQCVEEGTPRTMSGMERQKKGREYIKQIFGV
jgi:inosose dehydratase